MRVSGARNYFLDLPIKFSFSLSEILKNLVRLHCAAAHKDSAYVFPQVILHADVSKTRLFSAIIHHPLRLNLNISTQYP